MDPEGVPTQRSGVLHRNTFSKVVLNRQYQLQRSMQKSEKNFLGSRKLPLPMLVLSIPALPHSPTLKSPFLPSMLVIEPTPSNADLEGG